MKAGDRVRWNMWAGTICKLSPADGVIVDWDDGRQQWHPPMLIKALRLISPLEELAMEAG